MADVESAPVAAVNSQAGEASKAIVTPPIEADQGVTLPPEQEGSAETTEQRQEREARHERRQLRAERRQREQLIRENERLRVELEQRSTRQPQSRAPADDPDDPRPVMSDYQDMFEYQSDLAAWKVGQRGKREATVRAGTDRQTAEQHRIMGDLNRSIEAHNRSNPGSEREIQKLIDSGFRLPQGAIAALADMGDLAPAVLQHLARNPDEADDLEGLSEAAIIRRLGRLEAKLEGQPVPKQSKATSAPEPIAELTGRPANKVNMEKISMEDYAKLRKAQMKEEGRY